MNPTAMLRQKANPTMNRMIFTNLIFEEFATGPPHSSIAI